MSLEEIIALFLSLTYRLILEIKLRLLDDRLLKEVLETLFG